MFVVEEFDGLLIGLGALAAVVGSQFSSFSDLTAPAVGTIVVAMAFRLFRVRYQLENLEKAVTLKVQETDTSVVRQVREIEAGLVELRDTVISEGHHQAERCNRARFYEHMLRALESASESVDLTQLDARPPKHHGTPGMVAYFNRQAEVVKERPTVIFRRIVAIPTLEKLGWVLDVLVETLSNVNFQIRVVDISQSGALPAPLSLQIFDDREMCLVDPTVGYMLPEEQKNMLWVRGGAIPRVFSQYYDSIWTLSERLKEGSIIYWKVLADLIPALRARQPEEAELADELAERIAALSGRKVQPSVRRVQTPRPSRSKPKS